MRGMKNRAWAAAAIAAVCMVYVLSPVMAQAGLGEWTWMSGANTIDQIGVYGEKGIPAAANVPGARSASISWTDDSGNLWLFGGFGKDSIDRYGSQSLNDLWRYDTNGQWAWISGSKTFNQYGIYGTKGTPSAANAPGAHVSSTSWTDNSGNLWLFGGTGCAASGGMNYLNDLWRYEPATNQWTWMSGSDLLLQSGVYGEKGIPAAANVPGARSDSISWTDDSGSLWLFGGKSSIAFSTVYLNDLWRYEPAANQWTWMSGAATTNQTGVYGTQGVPDAANVPGARYGSISWTDNSGNLWLFGGVGYDSTARSANLNDLWRYNPVTNIWTWISGSSLRVQVGTYGTKGVPAAANVPGARNRSISWTDNSGNLWLFGGRGYDSTGYVEELNDLWRYNPGTKMWTWVSGGNIADQAGYYGTKGVADAANMPGAREKSISWTDNNGNFWLLGGWGYVSSNNEGQINDLWRYEVPPECATDADCGAGAVCEQGICDVPFECMSNADCSDSLYCNGIESCSSESSICVAGSSPCSEDQRCDETGDECIDIECLVTADCPEGEVCNVSTGLCVECVTSADCEDVYACVASVCEPIPPPSPWSFEQIDVQCDINRIVTLSETEIYAGGGHGVTGGGCLYRYDGSSWEPVNSPDPGIVFALWANTVDDVYVAGLDGKIHYDGTQWTTINTSIGRSIWGFPQNDVFIGEYKNIIRRQGENWVTMLLPAGLADVYIEGLWGTSAADMYAVCSGSTILHYDGNQEDRWDYFNNQGLEGTSYHFVRIWGSSAQDIFVLGKGINKNLILHYDGSMWTTFFAPVADTDWLKAIWGSGPDDVYVTSEKGYILHYDGISWSIINSQANPASQTAVLENNQLSATADLPGLVNLNSVYGISAESIYFAGNDGIVIHYTPEVAECANDDDCDDGVFCNGIEMCVEGACTEDALPCTAGGVCDEASDRCVECLEQAHCSAGYGCISNTCVEDNSPVIGAGPYLAAGSWPVLPTSQESPMYLDANNDVLWKFSDDFISCSENCTHNAEYQRVGDSSWTALDVTANAAKGFAYVTLPVESLQNATTYAFRFSVTDCASQTTQSQTYYFRVAITDAPPVITSGPFVAAGAWPVLATSSARATVLEQNEFVLWTFSDDYAFCNGLCTHRARYRKVGDTTWTWITVNTDPTGRKYAYTELPVMGLDTGTYQFSFDVRDCAGQLTKASKIYYFKVE